MRLNDTMWNIWTPNHLHLLAEGDGEDGGGGSDDGTGGDAGGQEGGEETNAADEGNSGGQGGGDGGVPGDDIASVMGSEKWIEHVPSEHLKAASKFNSLNDFVKGYATLESRMSSAIFTPDKDAGEEEWGKYYERLGRPREAGGYQAPEIEGIKVPEERQNAFFKVAHDLGLTQGHVEGLMRWEIESGKAAQDQAVRAHAAAHRALREEWGEQAPANYEKARRVGQVLFTAEQREAIGLSDDPKDWGAPFVAALADKAVSFLDHQIIGRGERDVGKSNEELMEEANKIRNDPNYENDPALQKRRSEIYSMVYGDQPADGRM